MACFLNVTARRAPAGIDSGILKEDLATTSPRVRGSETVALYLSGRLDVELGFALPLVLVELLMLLAGSPASPRFD